MYLNSSKDGNYEIFLDLAEKYNFEVREEAIDNFKYALYEVEFDVKVDTRTGDVTIIAVNGHPLQKRLQGVTYR